jgi:formylmethanofuran dehydrogenase subunit B
MSDNLTDALALLMDHLEHSMKTPPESGATIPPKQVLEMLQWMSSANYGSAVYLTRMLNAGVELQREDGKDIDAWIVEQVRMGNIARSAKLAFERSHGGVKEE